MKGRSGKRGTESVQRPKSSEDKTRKERSGIKDGTGANRDDVGRRFWRRRKRIVRKRNDRVCKRKEGREGSDVEGNSFSFGGRSIFGDACLLRGG